LTAGSELLRALVFKVRLFSVTQVACHWWPGVKGPQLANARRRLRKLERAGVIRMITVQAAPLPTMTQPVLVWRPGEPDPPY
jgi:hypothetical protein